MSDKVHAGGLFRRSPTREKLPGDFAGSFVSVLKAIFSSVVRLRELRRLGKSSRTVQLRRSRAVVRAVLKFKENPEWSVRKMERNEGGGALNKDTRSVEWYYFVLSLLLR